MFHQSIRFLASILSVAFLWGGCTQERCEESRDDRFGSGVDFAGEEPCNPASTLYKFLGKYALTESCNNINSLYELEIKNPDLNQYTVSIYNIYNTNGQYILKGEISKNQLSIPEQTVNNVTFSGLAIVSGKTLSGNYQLSTGTVSDQCSFTAVKP